MQYSHIIFDIDGTLIDTRHADLHGLQDTIMELQGRLVNIEDLGFAFGIPGEVALGQLGVDDPKEGNKLWHNNFMKYHSSIGFFEGIEELIKTLSAKGVNLGIITSKNNNEYIHDFIPLGLAEYFGTVIKFENSEKPKPSPYPMLKYLELTGARPEDAIYIGDTVYDFECAHNAGVAFGTAFWGAVANIPDAEHCFKTPDEILKIAKYKE